MFRRGKFAFLNTKDDRIKVVNERINLTEKHLIEMCCSFATCTGKLAKYRDSYDELAKSFKNYADDEEINETLSEGLKSFTNATTILADYMDVQVHRLEAKIVNELALYENVCKSTRDSLRTAVITRDKEVLKQRQMLELKSKFSANNSAADSELLKAKLEVNRSNKEIDDIINNFEMGKLSDIKSILTDFVLISMKYHTKALEALSASYYDVCNIDERSDFMEFQKLMKTKEDAKERQLKKAGIGLRSQSMESLKRDSHLSPAKRRNRLSRSTKNLTGRSDDELDDDQEDEDEEDEDEEEEEEDDEDEADSNHHDDDDSDSATEDNVKEAPSKSNLKEDLNYIKSKFQSKPQASHVFKSKLKQNPAASFAAKSGGVGIPSSKKGASTTNLKQRRKVQFSDNQLETAGRLVTLVESKKIKKRNVNHPAAAAEIEDVLGASAAVGPVGKLK